MSLFILNVQNADDASWRAKEGYHGLGGAPFQLQAIEAPHCALAAMRHPITLFGTNQAAVMYPSQPGNCRRYEGRGKVRRETSGASSRGG